jgi:acetyl esterase/lipase
MYRSTSATGDPVAVTGTLMVPTAAWPLGPRPLVAYAVGGHGMGRQCVPSVQFRQGTQVELAVVAAHLAQGWAVVVTDYQRTPAHTFLNAPASAHAVLDAARAALRVPGTGLGASPTTDPGDAAGTSGCGLDGRTGLTDSTTGPGRGDRNDLAHGYRHGDERRHGGHSGPADSTTRPGRGDGCGRDWESSRGGGRGGGNVGRVPIGIGGYGHGGLAAAAAAERQPAYAPELDLRAVTVGGAPADPAAVLREADGTDRAGLVPLVFASLRAAYPELTLDGLTTAGRNALAAVSRQCLPDLLDRWAGRSAAELTAGGVGVDEFLAAQPAWRHRVDDQALGRRAPRAPVLVFHGLGGTWVPHGVTRRLADAWRTGGADVRLAAYPAVEHGGALVEAIPEVHHWLGARLTA